MVSASGFCQRSEETFGPGPLFVFGRSLPHGIETVQGNPADIGPRGRHEIGASILEPLDPAADRPLVSRGTIDHSRPDVDLVRVARDGALRRRWRFRGLRLDMAAGAGPYSIESGDRQSRPVPVSLAHGSQESAARAPRIPRGPPGLCQFLCNGFNFFVCHACPPDIVCHPSETLHNLLEKSLTQSNAQV